MRIAILTMNDAATRAGETAPAHLRVGPLTIARHQLALMLVLGCERIICLSQRFDADLVALQHVAEAGQASFHVLTGHRGLPALITANDEVFALAEGLLPWPELARSLLDHAPVVLAQPIEIGLAAGFERLDINHTAAGAFRAPGRLVERMAELSADCDVFSGLQRIALQAGVPMVELPADASETGRWALVRDEAGAQAIEAGWIRLHTASATRTPSLMIARRLVRMGGAALLHAGSGSVAVTIAAVVLLALALVAAWFGLSMPALVLVAGGAALLAVAHLFGTVERAARLLPVPRVPPGALGDGVIDLALALVIMWGTPTLGGTWAPGRLFAPLVLLGATRLVARTMQRPWAPLVADRVTLAVLLALAAIPGWLGGAVDVLALAAIVAGLFASLPASG